MQLYRTKLIIIAVLLIISAWFFFTDTKSSFSEKYTQINVVDTATVDKIVISNDSLSIILEKATDFWRLNDNYNVRNQAINRVLATVSGLRMIAPVVNTESDSILKVLDERGVDVEIFSKGKSIARYTIGYKAASIDGTCITVGDDKSPIIAESFGSYFPLRRVFVPHEGYWRDLTVFRYRINEIKSVMVEYPKDIDNSYKIVIDENKKVRMLNPHGIQVVENVNKETVFQYFSYFSNVIFERVVGELSKQQVDSIKATTPEVVLTVEDYSGKTNFIKTYLKPNNNPKLEDDYKYDIYRMYGNMNNANEIIIVQYQFFDLLYKNPAFFIDEKN